MLYLLLTLLFSSISIAQVLPGARQTAISNSDIALSDDVFAVFNNPAGLSQIPWFESGFYYSPSPFGLKELANAYLALTYPFNGSSVSAGIMTYGYSLYRENKFLISYSSRMNQRFFVGAALNYHYISIKNYGSDASAYINIGVKGFLTSGLSWGFCIQNLNQATFGNEDDQIPFIFNTGFSFSYPGIFLLHFSLNKDLIYKYSLNGGIEYSFLDMLTIRSGLSTEPLKYTAGTGIHIKYFSFDYTVTIHRDLGLTHQVSLIYSLSSFKNRQKEILSFLDLDND